MREKTFSFEEKYAVQSDLMDGDCLEGLDERTLHDTIKAMLINTIKDCIKYENWMDPEMTKICNFISKEEKTEEEMRMIKNAQDRLRLSLHYSRVAEGALQDVLYKMLSEDYIKKVFKQDIPAMYENIYYLVDMEYDIAESLMCTFAEMYEAPSYKSICNIINNTIENFILDAEEYYDDIEKHEMYPEFVEFRKKVIERQPKEDADE